jgi:hypothetical protein
MVKTEDCYIVLDENGNLVEEYMEYLFDSVEEAETHIEKNDDDIDDYEIVSLIEFFDNINDKLLE